MAAAAIGGFALAPSGAYAVTIGGTAVPPGTVPFTLDNLGTSTTAGYQAGVTSPITPLNAPGQTISFVAGTGSLASGVYAGTTSDVAASPYGAESSPYSNYLVAQQGGGSVTISFSNSQSAFNLLWGTVDADPSGYNKLTFTFSGSGGSTTITGKDIANALGIPGNGTVNAAVMIGNLPSFTTVTASDDSQPAFEFVPGTPVPEPGSLALLGTGLLGLAFIGWTMKRRHAA